MPAPTVVRGIPASPGIAVGRVLLLDVGHVRVSQRRIDEDCVEAEIERLHRAVEASMREIEGVREALRDATEDAYGLVLDAHMLMHRDVLLIEGAITGIRDARINAEWALRRTIEDLCQRMRAGKDPYLRERANDVAHVGDHILRAMTGSHSVVPRFDEPAILVASDLTPADAARLLELPVLGLISDYGSASSHTAILARTLGIPAVVGTGDVFVRLGDRDLVIVDGLRGEVTLDPGDGERARAEERAKRYTRFTHGMRSRRAAETRTRDGTRVELTANVELLAEAAAAVAERADGIGLFRTEYLYLERNQPPTEEEQNQVYAEIVRAMAPRSVVFRTFDLGGDKWDPDPKRPARNPALGMRGIRLSFASPDVLRAQVRAVLRAATVGPVKIMFPLVSTIDELRRARSIVELSRLELEAKGEVIGPVAVGVMIEVPSAALLAEVFAKECDFFSIGTNDLVQYTLALDRTDPRVAHLGRTLDPSVLRLLDMVSVAAAKHRIGLSMCGDMAADPVALPVVIGLGYRSLSMPIGLLALAREVISRIEVDEARLLAEDALRCASADEVEALVKQRFSKRLGEIWSEHGLEPG